MTLLDVEVVKATRSAAPAAFIRRSLQRAASLPELEARLPEGRPAVAVRVTTHDELQRLNHTYAGEDHATDVLSFAGAGEHLGDIAISWPAVVRQAASYGHDERTEVALLAVHGLLHLLGWDHASASERREMTRLTVSALRLSGVTLARGRL